MKQVTKLKPMVQQRTFPTLRAAVLGFAVLTAGIAMTSCRYNNKTRISDRSSSSDKDTLSPTVTSSPNEKEIRRLIINAKYSPDKAIRMDAVNALRRNDEALADVACEAEFKDSRMVAISLIEGIDEILGVVIRTNCMDSRKASVKMIIDELKKADKNEMHQKLSEFTQEELEFHMILLAVTSVFTEDENTRQFVRYWVKQADDAHSGAEEVYDAGLAIFSTSKKQRLEIVNELKSKKLEGMLKKIAELSEYVDTRNAATKALEEINPQAIPELEVFYDINRFSQCKDNGEQIKSQNDIEPEKKKKMGIGKRMKRKARRIWNAAFR